MMPVTSHLHFPFWDILLVHHDSFRNLHRIATSPASCENVETLTSHQLTVSKFERRLIVKQFLAALLLAGMFVPVLRAADTAPPPTIKVGDMAPDFTLTDQNGNKVSLHEFKGKKNVALAFYIFAFTGG